MTASEDKRVRGIREALVRRYKPLHPQARIDVKRYNPVCIWVRIIDPDFARKDMVERDDAVWEVLDASAPEEARAEISMLVLLTPKESKTSQMSMEFEDPTPNAV